MHNIATQEQQTITLLTPHAKQAEILKGKERFKIIACGRRFGKTQMAMLAVALYALKGFAVAWVAPTNKILLEVFEALCNLLSPLVVTKSKIFQRIDLNTGGKIEFWSADIDKPCESRKYKFVVIDEAGSCQNLKRQWENSIRPTLADERGKAWFVGTPKGLNYFYELAKVGMAKENQDFGFYHATTYDNPYIATQEIEEARKTLPSLVFKQEYLAEFVSGAGAIMQPEWVKRQDALDLNDLEITMGVDLAVSTKTLADYTAIAVLGRARVDNGFKYYVLDVDRTRQTFQGIINFIKYKASKFNIKRIVIENVQAQAWIIQELVRTTNLPVVAECPTSDKVSRAMPLIAKYEHGYITHTSTITRPQEFEDELLSFPIGANDDMVDALVYALKGFGDTASVAQVRWV